VLAGRFKVERVINSGGMGIILVAHHLQLDQRVAIKVLRAHVLGDPDIVARFTREARIAAKIKSEHVVRVIDVGALPSGLPYMVMEHLQGSDLSALVNARGPMPHEEVVEYVLQACEALAQAHVAGIVHRDLKPANLFLTRRPDGSPLLKVLDFGISKVVEPFDPDGNMTKTSMLMGSPQYMSPEQLRSARKVDGRADIWALGVVMYRLLTGKNPFRAASTPELCVEILHKAPAPLRRLAPDAPEGLERVIGQCLRKRPDQRFSTVAELALALEPFAHQRAKASIERIAGVYRSADPAPPSGASDSKKTESTIRETPRTSASVDSTDAGARTMSEKSVAASVSERIPSRSGSRTPIYLGLATAAIIAAIVVTRFVPTGTAPSTSHAASPSSTSSAVSLPTIVRVVEPPPSAVIVADAATPTTVVPPPKPAVSTRSAVITTSSASATPSSSASFLGVTPW
jgi:serine/threonine-protein kinase